MTICPVGYPLQGSVVMMRTQRRATSAGTPVIAKSDLLILAVSAGALAFGVYRWQQNVAPATLATAPASERALEEAPSAPRLVADIAADEAAASALVGAPARTDAADGDGGDGRLVVRRIAGDGPDETDARDAGEVGGDVASAASGGRTAPGETSRADAATVATSDGNAGEPLYGVYRVRDGDYLGRIADEVGTSVSTLRSLNGIEGNLILVDQELRYPLPAN